MQKTERQPCKRCHGKGEIKMYQHVIGGVCFRCDGSGVEMTEAEVAAKKARDAAKARRIVLEEVSRREAALAAVIAAPARPVRNLTPERAAVDARLRAHLVSRIGEDEVLRREAELEASYEDDKAKRVEQARRALELARDRAAAL